MEPSQSGQRHWNIRRGADEQANSWLADCGCGGWLGLPSGGVPVADNCLLVASVVCIFNALEENEWRGFYLRVGAVVLVDRA